MQVCSLPLEKAQGSVSAAVPIRRLLASWVARTLCTALLLYLLLVWGLEDDWRGRLSSLVFF